MGIVQIFNKIKEFFISIKDILVSLDWQGILFVSKIVLIVISVFLFVGIIYLILRLNLIQKMRKMGQMSASAVNYSKKIIRKWAKIEQRVESGQEAELKLAVIEADKFLDDILKKIGYLGKSMGDRLKLVNSEQISNIDDIWQAHKARNNIVHDVDYKLSKIDAEKVIEIYKKALKELEVL